MRGMWLCEGWAVPRWLATMVPAWVGSTGWNLVPAWYLLLYLLLLLWLLDVQRGDPAEAHQARCAGDR